jgi:hypothetical protein
VFETVPVENGFFSVELSGMSLSFDVADVWVGIKVAGDGSEMSRQHVTAVPYAFRAQSVSGVVPPQHGGTGLDSAPVTAGQYLRSTGSGGWSIGTIEARDIGPGIDASQLKQPPSAKNGANAAVATIQRKAIEVATFTIDTPDAGAVFVTAVGRALVSGHQSGVSDHFDCTLGSTSPQVSGSQSFSVIIPKQWSDWGATLEPFALPVSTSYVATVPAAGS